MGIPTRRTILKGSGVAAAAAVAGTSAAQAAPAAGGSSRVATVVAVHGTAVTVRTDDGAQHDTELVGFPTGWSARVGDRVVLAGRRPGGEQGGALPLISHQQGRVRGGRLDVRGRLARPRTGLSLRSVRDADELDAFCMTNVHDGAPQVVALRETGDRS